MYTRRYIPAASGPMDRPTMYNVRRSCGVRDPGRRFWRRVRHKVTGSRSPYPSLLPSLSLSLFHVCEHLPPRRELPSPCSPLFFSRGSQGELLKLYCWALKRRKRRKNNMTLLPSAEAKEKKLYMRLGRERERERKSGCVVVVSFAVFRQPLSRLALVESSRQFRRDT